MKIILPDGSVEEAKDELRAIRHTASHVLAQAVKRLYPETKLAIGPAIDDGFYYDFDTPAPFSETQLEELEAAHPELASPLSPTRRVGGEALSKFEKVEHAVPLESLQDVFSPDEVREFDGRVRESVPDAV